MAIASKEEILQHLESIDVVDLLKRMEVYVRGRFYDKSERGKDGLEFEDFCCNLLAKVCDGTRKWDKDKASFEKFIFWALKSDIYAFLSKQKRRKMETSEDNDEVYLIDLGDFIDVEELESDHITDSNTDFDSISSDMISDLKSQEADELEISTFECWLEGYIKPKEIAELCGVSVFDINNAVKRLTRKTVKIKSKWGSLKT